MKTADRINKEKVSNKNLMVEKHIPSIEAGSPTEGILKLTPSAYTSAAELKTAQEQHNANHALYYFSMISDGAIYGTKSGNDCEKVRRIREHMTILREFISEERGNILGAINILLQKLEDFCPARRNQFNVFIYQNWQLISMFAEAYGHRERCFSEEKGQKLRDVITGRRFVRVWWWKIVTTKLTKKIYRVLLRSGYSRIKQNPIAKRFYANQKNVKTADEKQTKKFFMSLFSNITCVMEFKIGRRASYLSGKSVYDESTKNKILYFLGFVKGHYPTTPATGELMWGACDDLTEYFTQFPNVTEEHSRKALQRMDELCKAAGISYARKFSSSMAQAKN